MSNTFGNVLRLTTFGESHGPAIGGILDGVPAGIEIDADAVRTAMSRRRPGQSALTTQRRESDEVTFLSGIFEGRTLGTPIAFSISNTDAHSSDYDNMRDIYRPSHADFTYEAKYGLRDHRGGGRASARETAVRVAAGEIAHQILRPVGITLRAWTSAIGSCRMNAFPDDEIPDISAIEASPLRCPDPTASRLMAEAIEMARKEGDSLGGIVECRISGVPAGLGEPIFNKLQACLAYAMMGIPAAKGFDYGDGFDALSLPGSFWTDTFATDPDGNITTITNHSGGIQGGISNGSTIRFRVGFKPVATMIRPTATVSRDGNKVTFTPHGRHDVCVVPRAVPVVEAMAWLVLADMYLSDKTSRLR